MSFEKAFSSGWSTLVLNPHVEVLAVVFVVPVLLHRAGRRWLQPAGCAILHVHSRTLGCWLFPLYPFDLRPRTCLHSSGVVPYADPSFLRVRRRAS